MRRTRAVVTMTGLLAMAVVCAAAAADAAGEAPGGKLAPDLKSPTLGRKPPEGAVVLLPFEEGKAPSLDAWDNKTWQAGDDGSIVKGQGDQRTREDLGDVELHLEFNILPGKDGGPPPAEGNSGVYIMDRYEIQILDSYGRKATDNECGAVYRKIAPKVNASLPAGRWQTFDITFHAPRFDDKGAKTQSVRVTLVHNGVKVHDNVEVPGPTGAASGKKEVAKAPLRLQDHGPPVKFRNIWYAKPKD
jgi:hypothetical protein